jgi:hypothetical protein
VPPDGAADARRAGAITLDLPADWRSAQVVATYLELMARHRT